jgi:hypothetical protein
VNDERLDADRAWMHRMAAEAASRRPVVAPATAEEVYRGGGSFCVVPPPVGNVYVDSANGDDANDGLTPRTAKRTFAAAYAIAGIAAENETVPDGTPVQTPAPWRPVREVRGD